MIVDVAFGVRAARGASIPTDHGYLLYGAITQEVPTLHGTGVDYALHPVYGDQLPGRALGLGARSAVTFRLDHELMPMVLPLAGKTLRIGPAAITLGVAAMRPLRPSTTLRSRLVVIKGFMEPEAFLGAARRQLAALDIRATPGLLLRRREDSVEGRTSAGQSTPIRRTIRIHERDVVGFAVGVEQLTAEESVRLQEVGLGGRRRFGCGVFVPWSAQ